MHCEIREQHYNVVLNAHYQSGVVLKAPSNDLHVVSLLEELLELMSWELQWVLATTTTIQMMMMMTMGPINNNNN